MSYRVLLIDDNQLALESMEKTIPLSLIHI